MPSRRMSSSWRPSFIRIEQVAPPSDQSISDVGSDMGTVSFRVVAGDGHRPYRSECEQMSSHTVDSWLGEDEKSGGGSDFL